MSSPIVASRRSFDNAIVFLHKSGELSTRLFYIRGGKLPLASMWRLADDICTYTVEELPDFIRTARTGKIPAKPRPSAARSAEIMAANSADRVRNAWVRITYDRSLRMSG